MSRAPLSPERVAKRRGAKPGVPKSEAHKARLSASMRRYWDSIPEDWQRRRGVRRFMDDDEAADFCFLRRKYCYSKAEALAAIGRADLLDLLKRP